MSKKIQFESLGVYAQLRNLVRDYMLIKKHFLYIDSINEIKGNKDVQKVLNQMESKIENIKRNIQTYKKSL